jgi:hypothetical protein
VLYTSPPWLICGKGLADWIFPVILPSAASSVAHDHRLSYKPLVGQRTTCLISLLRCRLVYRLPSSSHYMARLLPDVMFTSAVRQRCQSCLLLLSNQRASAPLGSAQLDSLRLYSARHGVTPLEGRGLFTECCTIHVTIFWKALPGCKLIILCRMNKNCFAKLWDMITHTEPAKTVCKNLCFKWPYLRAMAFLSLRTTS